MLTFRRWSITPSPLLFTLDLSLIFHVSLHTTELGFSSLLSLSLSLITCLLLLFSTPFFNYHLLPFTATAWSSCILVFTLAFYNLFQVPLLIAKFLLLDLNLPWIFPIVFFHIVQVSLITKFLLLHPVGSLVLFFSLPFSELSCIITRIFLLTGKYWLIFILSSHNCDRFFL